MSETGWILLLLVLVAALVYGAFLLGRASALSQVRQETSALPQPTINAPVREASAPQRSPGAVPPPAMAGGEHAPAHPEASAPRRSAPPPAATAGPSSGGGASASSTPRRTAAPPPAQAAWTTSKTDKS